MQPGVEFGAFLLPFSRLTKDDVGFVCPSFLHPSARSRFRLCFVSNISPLLWSFPNLHRTCATP